MGGHLVKRMFTHASCMVRALVNALGPVVTRDAPVTCLHVSHLLKIGPPEVHHGLTMYGPHVIIFRSHVTQLG